MGCMRLRAAALAATSIVTVACSSERASPQVSESPTASADDTGSSPTAAEASSPSTPDGPANGSVQGSRPTGSTAPRGTIIVRVDELGLSFAVPETYTPLDAAELDESFYAGPAFTELAGRAGLTPDEFRSFLEDSIDLYVFAPASAEGYVDNLTVTGLPGTELPPREAVERTLTDLGAQELAVEQERVGELDVLSSTYALQVNSQPVFGVDLQLVVGDQPVEITITSGAQETATDLGSLVLDTVAAQP